VFFITDWLIVEAHRGGVGVGGVAGGGCGRAVDGGSAAQGCESGEGVYGERFSVRKVASEASALPGSNYSEGEFMASDSGKQNLRRGRSRSISAWDVAKLRFPKDGESVRSNRGSDNLQRSPLRVGLLCVVVLATALLVVTA
jgi:hypothetical protein